MPKRNWKQIVQLTDQHTKRALILARYPEILEGYAKGFPHLFLQPGEAPTPMPLSVLMEAAEEQSKLMSPYWSRYWQEGRHFMLTNAGIYHDELKIPATYTWNRERGSGIPTEILDQLIGQRITAGMNVNTTQREKHVVLDMEFSFQGSDSLIGTVLRRRPELNRLVLADAALIDLTM